MTYIRGFTVYLTAAGFHEIWWQGTLLLSEYRPWGPFIIGWWAKNPNPSSPLHFSVIKTSIVWSSRNFAHTKQLLSRKWSKWNLFCQVTLQEGWTESESLLPWLPDLGRHCQDDNIWHLSVQYIYLLNALEQVKLPVTQVDFSRSFILYFNVMISNWCDIYLMIIYKHIEKMHHFGY